MRGLAYLSIALTLQLAVLWAVPAFIHQSLSQQIPELQMLAGLNSTREPIGNTDAIYAEYLRLKRKAGR